MQGSTRAPVNSKWIALLVAGAFFMENLDGTVITTAVPDMARSFGVAPLALNIGVSAYLLTLGVFIPISGWVAERFGARRVFAAALAIFTLASVLCGMAHSLGEFVWLRVLQGAGGAASRHPPSRKARGRRRAIIGTTRLLSRKAGATATSFSECTPFRRTRKDVPS